MIRLYAGPSEAARHSWKEGVGGIISDGKDKTKTLHPDAVPLETDTATQLRVIIQYQVSVASRPIY